MGSTTQKRYRGYRLPDEFEHYHAESLIGDSLTTLISTREWEVFKTEILDELHKAAFDKFQKVDPTKSEEVMEVQQMALIVRSIEGRINNLIQVGRLAKTNLAKLSDEEDT